MVYIEYSKIVVGTKKKPRTKSPQNTKLFPRKDFVLYLCTLA